MNSLFTSGTFLQTPTTAPGASSLIGGQFVKSLDVILDAPVFDPSRMSHMSGTVRLMLHHALTGVSGVFFAVILQSLLSSY